MEKNIANTLRICRFVSHDIFDSNTMRKIVLLILSLVPLTHAATPLEASIADTLASYNIIVNNSQNPAGYRLGDTVSRAEAI